MKNFIGFFLILFSFGNIDVFAQEKSPTVLSSPPKIVTSINPIYQIVKFISGGEKNNLLLIQPNFAENTHQINSGDIQKINNADVLFFVSSDLESSIGRNLSKIGPHTKVVELIKLPSIKKIVYKDRVGNETVDPNIWLSLANAAAIGIEVTDTLSKLYPPMEKEYRANLQKLYNDGAEIDRINRARLAGISDANKNFVVDVDRFRYFTDYYGFKPKAIVRYDNGYEPTMEGIEKINQTIKEQKAVCMLILSQGNTGLASQIASNNKIRMGFADVIGKTSYSRKNGYMGMMEDLSYNIFRCLDPNIKN